MSNKLLSVVSIGVELFDGREKLLFMSSNNSLLVISSSASTSPSTLISHVSLTTFEFKFLFILLLFLQT